MREHDRTRYPCALELSKVLRVVKAIPASLAKRIKDADQKYPELARAAGYASAQQIANLVCSRRVHVTELSIERLQKLAELVGYEGPVLR